MNDDINSGLRTVPMMKPFERTRVRYSRLMIAFNLSISLALRLFILSLALRQLFQEPSREFRAFPVLGQFAFQPFEIFGCVHVAPFRQRNQIQLGLSGALHSRVQDASAAPRDVLENSSVKFAHPHEVITAVFSRADDDVFVRLETFEGVEHVLSRQRRAVRADDDHGLEAEREEVGETVSQTFAQVFAPLRYHQGAFALDLFKSLLFAFWGVAESEREILSLIPHIFHQRECVAEERDIEASRLFGAERARQAGFYFSRARRFRHYDQCLFQMPSPRSIRLASSQRSSISSSETS